MPIASATILTGLAINFASELIVSTLISFRDTGVDHDLKLAYQSALTKWSKNPQLRHQSEHLSRQKLEEVQEHLNGNDVNFDLKTLQFIEIFKKEICDKKYQSLYNYISLQLHEGQSALLNKINDQHSVPIGKVPELKVFVKPQNYIDRTVSGYSHSSTLVEIIKNEHAVALIGEGGLGKSTELDYVASILSTEGWYCGLIRLIDYVDSLEKLIELQFEYWQNIPVTNHVLVLLDGLDEVNSSNISKVENEIIELTRSHKNVHFLISYRNSYSLFLSLDNEKTESNEMVRVMLNPISTEIITSYIENNAINPSFIIEQFRKQNLFKLCKNPFYLVNYIKIINNSKKVPDSKSEFFDQILSIRFQSEKRKGSEVSREVKRRERSLLIKLEDLALTMQLAGKYQIANTDIQGIIEDPDLLETSRRIVLYESGITDSDNWRFEHNNFQEYLAAKRLAKCNWDQMQKILFLANKKLKPKWYNAISFLINQLKPTDEKYSSLIEWLCENDRVAFIKLEVVHLDKIVRNRVFNSVYSYYKEKEIVFYAEFSAQELAKFCDLENDQVLIDFLFKDIKQEMNIQNLYNIVELFKVIKPADKKDIGRIAMALSGYLENEKYNTYNINSSILETYLKWEWRNDTILKEIITADILIQDYGTRSSLIRYCIAISPSSISAKFILRCLKIRGNDKVISGDIFTIKEAISVLNHKELVLLLDGITLRDVNDQKRRQKGDFIEVVKAIEERASFLYPSHNEILPAINKFVLATMEHVFRVEPVNALKPFYIKNHIVFPLFRKYFLSEKQQIDAEPIHIRFKLSGFLANPECLDWIHKEYQKGNILVDDIKNFRTSMIYFSNKSGYQLITKKMNEISDGAFFPVIPDVYTETQNKVETLYAKAILDRDLYINYVENYFTYHGKDEITWREYWNREDRAEHLGVVDFQLSHQCLRDFVQKDKNNAKVEILNYLKTDGNWHTLQVQKHYELSRYGILPEKNIQWIKTWCKNHEHEIDFKNAIKDNEKGGITYTYYAIYYIEFCLNTGYHSQSKQILLDLIACVSDFVARYKKDGDINHKSTLYEYLQLHLRHEEINEQIIKNLNTGVSAETVLKEYLAIIKENNILSAVAFLPKYILNKNLNKWFRGSILSTFFHLNGSVYRVKDLLVELTFKGAHNEDWHIVDEFIRVDKKLSFNKLISFVDDELIDKYKLAIRMIKCGQIEGLNLLHAILKEHNGNGQYDEFRMGHFEAFVKEGDFNGVKVINLLTDLVILHLQPGFHYDEWSNLISQLFNLLWYYYSSENYALLKSAMGRIEEALSASENNSLYQIIYRHYQKLHLDMNIQTNSECDIDEAISKLKNLSIEV